MKTDLQNALKAMEAKVRNSLSRIDGASVQFKQIEKHSGFFMAVYTVNVPITDAERENGEEQS